MLTHFSVFYSESHAVTRDFAHCSTFSSSVHTLQRPHLVNMAARLYTQLPPLPQHTIQKFAQSVVNKHLSCMMSLLHVSALQHDRISLCVLFHSLTGCTVFVSDASLLHMGHTNLFHNTSL